MSGGEYRPSGKSLALTRDLLNDPARADALRDALGTEVCDVSVDEVLELYAKLRARAAARTDERSKPAWHDEALREQFDRLAWIDGDRTHIEELAKTDPAVARMRVMLSAALAERDQLQAEKDAAHIAANVATPADVRAQRDADALESVCKDGPDSPPIT